MALLAMPPRHTTACAGSTKKPMDSIFTPYCSIGSISVRPSTSAETGRQSSVWNIFGMLGP